MTPFYLDDWLTVYGGDCRTVLAELEADSVDCVVTSPPYWNLRDYGTASWTGGDADHKHVGARQLAPPPGSSKQASVRGSHNVHRGDCACGAVRVDQQLGLEATPGEYVDAMVDVFREVRRVLKPSGTLWLNLGDSYADRANASQGALHRVRRDKQMPPRTAPRPLGLKDKDLVGIPFRVVLALQADGWWWRQTIVWAKPNPMPESVRDRPTTSHEYVFLLTKAATYFYDQEAVREPVSAGTHARLAQDLASQAGSARANGGTRAGRPMKAVARSDKQSEKGHTTGTRGDRYAGFNERWRKAPAGRGDRLIRSHEEWHAAHALPVPDRNMRSVWTIPTQPYKGAHFAVFPAELPRRCILAGSPEGGVVLDPFGGSGTVGMVAQQLRRRAVLIDLNPEYLEQQMERAARAWGVGGRRLVDRPAEPPADSLWSLTDAAEVSA